MRRLHEVAFVCLFFFAGVGCDSRPHVKKSFDLAYSAAQSIEEPSTRRWAFEKIALAQAEAGYRKAALSIADSTDSRDEILKQIAIKYAQDNDPEAARNVAEQIETDYVKEDAYVEVATALVQGGNLTAALDIIPHIEPPDRSKLQARIAVAWARAKNPAKALAAFAQAVESAQDKPEALQFIAALQVEAGDPKGAFDTARRISYTNAGYYSRRALHDVAVAQIKAGYMDDALKTVKIIIAEQQDDQQGLPGEIAREFAAAQARAGHVDVALETARSSRGSGYADIALALAEAGHTADALEIARNVDYFYRIMSAIAIARAKFGDVATALEIAETTQSAERKQAFMEIALAYARQRDFEEALKTAERIEEASWEALAEVAVIQARAGDALGAQATFEKALEGAQNLSGEQSINQALRAIAIAQAKAGAPEAAFETAQRIENTEARVGALTEIGLTLARASSESH